MSTVGDSDDGTQIGGLADGCVLESVITTSGALQGTDKVPSGEYGEKQAASGE